MPNNHNKQILFDFPAHTRKLYCDLKINNTRNNCFVLLSLFQIIKNNISGFDVFKNHFRGKRRQVVAAFSFINLSKNNLDISRKWIYDLMKYYAWIVIYYKIRLIIINPYPSFIFYTFVKVIIMIDNCSRTMSLICRQSC